MNYTSFFNTLKVWITFFSTYILVVAFPHLGYCQEKTSLQTHFKWSPKIDIRSDIAIIYGMDATFAKRQTSWKIRGYNTQFMTAMSWGEYQNYFQGKFDGSYHKNEIQMDQKGNYIMHGKNTPYLVPDDSFVTYMKSLVRRAIRDRVSAIYIEEPEFFARAGYSKTFRKAWKQFYGKPWKNPDSSPEAWYRSSLLKVHIFEQSLNDVFKYAKEISHGKVKCFVATHSVLNYSLWQIDSPEVQLLKIPYVDGFIGQVWSGTARTPVYYQGKWQELTFQNAYLEYGAIRSMTKGSGKRIYFLTDPVGDNPKHSWQDFRLNYEKTLIAELMYPSVNHYEVMPWPHRIYYGKYRFAGSNKKTTIPPSYATELQSVVNTLQKMPSSNDPLSGTNGVGIMVSNTLMYQGYGRFKGNKDPRKAGFYGLALPLIEYGIPVKLIYLDRLGTRKIHHNIKILLMTYSDMKPLKEEYHEKIANWVKSGGHLIYISSDQDPFQHIKAWWNTSPYHYKYPINQLWDLLGVSKKIRKGGSENIGKGSVTIVHKYPGNYILQKNKAANLVKIVKKIAIKNNLHWSEHNYFNFHRGHYIISAVMKHSFSNKPLILKGDFIDLLNPHLPVISKKIIPAGQVSLLLNINSFQNKTPKIVATTGRIYDQNFTDKTLSFQIKAPRDVWGICDILSQTEPQKVVIDGKKIGTPNWNAHSHILKILFRNSYKGNLFHIQY